MSDPDRDWEKNYYILRKSWYLAALTEKIMDSRLDLNYQHIRAHKLAVVDIYEEVIVE